VALDDGSETVTGERISSPVGVRGLRARMIMSRGGECWTRF
jgi:hypothetical protein